MRTKQEIDSWEKRAPTEYSKSMKRYRLYIQYKGSLKKLRYRNYNKSFTIKQCGYSSLQEAEDAVEKYEDICSQYYKIFPTMGDNSQLCIIDFETGKIVKLI